MNGSRLWPVCLVLGGMLTGALLLEHLAEKHSVSTLEIEVRTHVPDDEGLIDEVGIRAAALSPAHQNARQLARRGELDDALTTFGELTLSNPGNADIWAERGYWLRRAGRMQESEASLRTAIEISPEDPRAWLDLGLMQEAAANNDDALGSYQRALKLRPNHSATRTVLGDLLRRLERKAEALAVLEPACEHGNNEERAKALVVRGRCLIEAEHLAEGRRSLDEAVERAPASVNIWIWAARAYLSSEHKDDAERGLLHALQAVKLAPGSFVARGLLGRAYEQNLQPEEAKTAYAGAVELNPDFEYGLKRLLRSSLDEGKVEQARKRAQALLLLDAQNAEHEFLAGLVEFRAEQFAAARAHYQQALSIKNGRYAEAHYNLGLLERSAGNPEAALAAYEEALKLDPKYRGAYNNMGLVFMDMKQYPQARQAFESAVNLDPNYGGAWKNLARCLSLQGEHKESARAYKQAATHMTDARATLLNMAIALRKSGQAAEAIDVYRDLLKRHPRYAAAWFNLGIALTEAEQFTKALAAYEQALAVSPENRKALKNLGLLEAQLGQKTEARFHLSEALDRDPSDTEVRIRLAQLHLSLQDHESCRNHARVANKQLPNDEAVAQLLLQCAN